MTDPAVSPFDLIREALDGGVPLLHREDRMARRQRAEDALDQLQRDHEALRREIERLQALHLERTKLTDRDLRELIAERDAAVREAETLREALRVVRDWIRHGVGSESEAAEALDAALASSRDTTEADEAQT